MASLRSATKSLSRAPVQSLSSYAHGGRNDRPPRAASSCDEMHDGVSGQRSRRPSLTPSARAARGLATSAAAAAPTLRRRIAHGFAVLCGDAAAAVRSAGLRSAAHRSKLAVICSAIQSCACLRMIPGCCCKIGRPREYFASHLAGCMAQASLSRLSGSILDEATYTPKLKQEMLLHKIGAFWDGPGWTKHRHAVRRAIRVLLCHATAARRAVGRRHKL